MSGGVVYTCVTGGRDGWRMPYTVDARPSLPAVRFTDEPVIPRDETWRSLTHEGWSLRTVRVGYSPVLAAKFPKCLPHVFLGEYDWSLWVDGSLQVDCDPLQLAETYLKDSDVALYRHPQRTTVLQEAQGVSAHGMDDPYRIQGQMMKYTMEHFAGQDLYCGTVLLRRHTEAVAKMGETWLAEILAGSIRDQISLPYALWKAGITPSVIPGNPFDGVHFTHHNHVKEEEALHGMVRDVCHEAS